LKKTVKGWFRYFNKETPRDWVSPAQKGEWQADECTAEQNVIAVEELVLSQDSQPQIYLVEQGRFQKKQA
jgi:hypothetical protein